MALWYATCEEYAFISLFSRIELVIRYYEMSVGLISWGRILVTDGVFRREGGRRRAREAL